jgi:hypothetical protein
MPRPSKTQDAYFRAVPSEEFTICNACDRIERLKRKGVIAVGPRLYLTQINRPAILLVEYLNDPHTHRGCDEQKSHETNRAD